MLLENFDDFEKAKNDGFTYNSESGKWDLSQGAGYEVRKRGLTEGKFPFPIGTINGFFTINNAGLKSLKNLPVHVMKHMEITNFQTDNNLKDLPTRFVEHELKLYGATLTNLESNLERAGALNLQFILGLKDLKGIENLDCQTLSISNCVELKDLSHVPKHAPKLIIKECSGIKDLTSLKPGRLFDVVISGCKNLTTLNGLPNTVKKIKVIGCSIPIIEEDFAVHINLHGFKDYYLDLLKFIVKAKREGEISKVNWPEDIKSRMPELIRSLRGINKYNI
jgi:hypothetical protein